MKCPKCDYLGFETGDRCRNCGYDFSLLSAAVATPEPDLPLRHSAPDERARTTPWVDQLDRMFGEPEPVGPPAATVSEAQPEPALRVAPALTLDDTPMLPPVAFRGEPALLPRRNGTDGTQGLPLFSPAADDDEPLVKLPATPRPPLAVRRTPDRQRLRAIVKTVEEPEIEPTLEFSEAPESAAPEPARRTSAGATQTHREVSDEAAVSRPGARLTAAVIDHGILFAIDLVIVYFTLRLTWLAPAEWRSLPLAPLLAFLAMVKVAYFSAFTAVGGQTIGKMAAGIRVVSEDRGHIDPARAIQRTIAGAVSFVTFGLAFIPALFGHERRALHDRLAHTRVIHF